MKNSGKLVSFVFFNQEWPLEPKTLSYEVLKYDAFTDIEFNHNKSINYQAYSASLFVSLVKRNLIEQAIRGSDEYKEIILK